MRYDPICGQFRVYEGGGGGQTTSTTQNFSPAEAAQRALVQQEAARIYGETSGAIQGSAYPGPKPVNWNDQTLQGYTQIANYTSPSGAAQQQANNAATYSSFLMGPAQYAESNPYLQSAIGAATRPITQAYSGPGGALSQTRSGATSAGQYGSSRHGIAEGMAHQGYLQAVGDVSSRMANENYQAAQTAAGRALALAPQTQQMGLMPGQTGYLLGTDADAQNQLVENYAAKGREWEMNAPWAALQNYAGIVYGGAAPGTTTSSQGGGPSKGASALGGAASGAMIGSMIMPGWGTAIGAGVGLLAGMFA